jgi:uncharacterized protein YhaN
MTRRPSAIKRLDVRRMPGFRLQGFQVKDLSPGINVIHGPNASGKTTLANAIKATLWPTTAPSGAETDATIQVKDATFNVRHEGRTTRWLKDGESHEPPVLPPADASDRYVLCLHELLGAEGDGDRFARTVMEESAGGYHLPSAIETAGFTQGYPTRKRGNDLASLTKARDEKDQAIAFQREIHQQEGRLERLRDDLQKARNAARTARMLEAAHQHAEAREEYEKAKRRLEAYPETVSKVVGDEKKRIESAEAVIQKASERNKEAERTIQEATEAIRSTRLPTVGVDSVLLRTLKTQTDTLDQHERDLLELEQVIRAHTKRLEEAQKAIGDNIGENVLAGLDGEKWNDISDFADEWQNARNELRQAQLEQARLEPLESSEDEDNLRRGIDALRAWLRQGPSKTERPLRAPLLLSAATGALTAVAAAVLLHMLFLLPALILLAVVAWGFLSDGKQGGDPATWRRAYESTRLSAPSQWESKAVEAQLERLEAQWLKAKEAARARRRNQELQAQIDRLQTHLVRLEKRRQEAEALFGPIGKDPRNLVWTIDRCLKWRHAHDDKEAAIAQHSTLTEKRDRLLKEIQQQLAPYGAVETTQVARLRAEIHALEEREHQRASAIKDLENAQRQQKEAQGALTQAQHEKDQVYQDLGVSAGDDQALVALLEQHISYQQDRRRADDAKAAKKAQLGNLHRHEDHDEVLEAASLEEIEKRLEAARDEAAHADPLNAQIAQIEQSIRDAKQATQVQKALLSHDEAQDTLRDALIEDAHNMIGHLIARSVQEADRDTQRPPVFHRARQLLLDFTRGRYRLEFTDTDPPRFRAHDTTTGQDHELHELSSGTRMQLLLAVRVAFVEKQETDTALPLILDEVLANSDDLRSRAIMDAIIALSSQGRQVVYLSAQADEVAKWRACLEEQGAPHKIIDLAEARALAERLETSTTLPHTTRTNVPSPDGNTHQEYARLIQAPTYDPRQGPGSLHLWYLIERPSTLYQVLSEGITRWGQLAAWLEHGIPLPAQDDAAIARIQALARAAEAYTDAWCIGRGRPVDRLALEASGAVTDNHIDALVEIAEQCGGDAREVLQAIDDKQVKRFRQEKRRDLEAYMIEEGHLETREPLDDESIRTRVLASVTDALRDGTITKGDIDRLLDRLAQKATTPASQVA